MDSTTSSVLHRGINSNSSTPEPALSDLQLVVLGVLAQHESLCDTQIWQKLNQHAWTPLLLSCFDLESLGLIEKFPADPSRWQLTDHGRKEHARRPPAQESK